jgi:hypothetical protein
MPSHPQLENPETMQDSGHFRWRDPDSNRGHHDFQTVAREPRTPAEVLERHGFEPHGAGAAKSASCMKLSEMVDTRTPRTRGGSIAREAAVLSCASARRPLRSPERGHRGRAHPRVAVASVRDDGRSLSVSPTSDVPPRLGRRAAEGSLSRRPSSWWISPTSSTDATATGESGSESVAGVWTARFRAALSGALNDPACGGRTSWPSLQGAADAATHVDRGRAIEARCAA